MFTQQLVRVLDSSILFEFGRLNKEIRTQMIWHSLIVVLLPPANPNERLRNATETDNVEKIPEGKSYIVQ